MDSEPSFDQITYATANPASDLFAHIAGGFGYQRRHNRNSRQDANRSQ